MDSTIFFHINQALSKIYKFIHYLSHIWLPVVAIIITVWIDTFTSSNKHVAFYISYSKLVCWACVPACLPACLCNLCFYRSAVFMWCGYTISMVFLTRMRTSTSNFQSMYRYSTQRNINVCLLHVLSCAK